MLNMNDFEIEKAFSDFSWHCNGKYDEPRHWRHGCRLPLDCYRIRFIICSLTIGFLVRLPQSWTHCMKPQQNLRLTPPSKKHGTIKVYILQSQTPTSTKWYSQLSHDPFTIQDAHAAGVLSWPSAWSPFFFTWESGNRACQIQRNKYVVFKTSSLPNGLAQPC